MGDRFLCVGDAVAFVDPIFSSGVFIAMRTGELAAEAIRAAFADGRFTARRFAGYERQVWRGVAPFFKFIHKYYEPAFLDLFLRPRDVLGMVKAVLNVLSGGSFIRMPLRVRFALSLLFGLTRLQAWGPVLIPALFFALGNVVGGLLRGFAEQMYRRLSGWLQLGRQRASATGLDTGTVIPRDRLAAIVPGETTYEQVLHLCGPEVEEREDLALPRRKTLVYRGRRDVPHRRWGWSWLAAVSYWDVERHELEITMENGVVQNIQLRIGRARAARL